MESSPIDILWILLSATLVLLMQAGLLCLESGLTRTKNSINVAIKNIADFALSSIIFATAGFAIIFGSSIGGVLGMPEIFTQVRGESASAYSIFLFQMMFCGTAVTIVSGAVAERIRSSSYLLVTVVLSTLIYPLFGHWVWNAGADGAQAGWLNQLGFVDFAGSTVVHGVGGWAALALVMIIGPRKDRFVAREGGGTRTQPFTGYNAPLAMLGALLLWIGWIGFNGGSTLAFDDRVPKIIANTILAACGGSAAGMAFGATRCTTRIWSMDPSRDSLP